jgi:phage tail sheath protein FI
MAELTFKSPGVSAREIDLSGPTGVTPVGIPAGVIGTANLGPAFVPVTFGSLQDFVTKFGESDGEKQGPLAAIEWLKSSRALTYMRVLGAGKGMKRTETGDNIGKVENAGFVVGQTLPQTNGQIGQNTYATVGNVLGRTHFLGCFMSESAGSTVFSQAGIQTSGDNIAAPIIRGILFAASGVVPMLSTSLGNSAAPGSSTAATAAGPNGTVTGTIDLSSGRQEFVILLNGHKGTDPAYPNVITASFDMTSVSYFGNVLNTDPLKLEQAGHLLYTKYDVHPTLAVVTGSGLLTSTSLDWKATGYENAGFITTGALGRNAGSTTVPNYESYEDRFSSAKAPYVVSQDFGGTRYNLFQVHALSAGAYANTQIKISVQNISRPSVSDEYPTFDLVVRSFDDTDSTRAVLEQFLGINLNPNSDRYIARVIGDMNSYYDFDRAQGSQKLVIAGNHENKSSYIRVAMHADVEADQVPVLAQPMGFRGPYHLVTSGSAHLTSPASGSGLIVGEALKRAVEPPVPFRLNIANGVDPRKTVNRSLYWGVQFEHQTSLTETNKSEQQNETIEAFTKYHPRYHTSWQEAWVGENTGVATSGGTIFDADRFNNNFFSLERIQIRTGSNGLADPKEWTSASYVRNGNISTNDANKTRALLASDFTDSTVRALAKFSFFVQGGYDGVNVFNEDTAKLTNTAIKREMDDQAQFQASGPTVKAYQKALQIMGNTSDVEIKLLAIPGIRHSIVTDEALRTVEDRFDALYIMDVEERDTLNAVVTSSIQDISVTNTAGSFKNRALDTSFGAAYFPDVIIEDPFTHTNVRVAPSVGVLGAFALNDSVAFPWFAPAGFTRGALASTVNTAVSLNRSNLDALYDADINPLTSFPSSSGVIVWGQKTLLQAASALDRVNVRRLLIEIRREIRDVANSLLFEPNRESTLKRFSDLANPRLTRIQSQSGIDRFKVIIDTTTTTQADIENNTIRGQIFVQPTKTAEFVSLDFVVANNVNV